MKVLVVAAHPDDEVLGAGATIARLAREGASVAMAILGEGVTSRYPDGQAPEQALVDLHAATATAAATLGVDPPSLHGLPDNRFDSVDLLDIVLTVEGLIDTHEPDVVVTHHWADLNIDHSLVSRAVLTATRPMADQRVHSVLAFEVPSSTEWGFQRLEPVFRPSWFVPVDERDVQRKIDAMAAYAGEARAFPHPRSPEALRAIATRWGTVVGQPLAEAFELVRSVRSDASASALP